jgi:single-strand DNA-binding protein
VNEIMSTVFGNIASEPRHSVPQQGAPRTSFRLASTSARYDPGVQGYVEGHTTWLTVTCWRGLAFNAARSLRKGQPVLVHGVLHVREWSDGDRSGRELELDAVSVGHDLRRGSSEFARVMRPVADRVLLAGTPTDQPGGGAPAPSDRSSGPGSSASEPPGGLGSAPSEPPGGGASAPAERAGGGASTARPDSGSPGGGASKRPDGEGTPQGGAAA